MGGIFFFASVIKEKEIQDTVFALLLFACSDHPQLLRYNRYFKPWRWFFWAIMWVVEGEAALEPLAFFLCCSCPVPDPHILFCSDIGTYSSVPYSWTLLVSSLKKSSNRTRSVRALMTDKLSEFMVGNLGSKKTKKKKKKKNDNKKRGDMRRVLLKTIFKKFERKKRKRKETKKNNY